MNPETGGEKETVLMLIKQNQELLKANNDLLNKIDRREIRQFWFKVVWYLILLGVPLFAYYYLYNTFLGNLGGGDAQSNLNYEMIKEALKLYQGQ